MIYPPQEDSILLAQWVAKRARGRVLDVGTGSGIQAQAAAARKAVKSVLAVDIDPAVVAHCRKNVVAKKISCVHSDLFARVTGQFDTIIFNPPYLPQELPERDIALEGGKQGYETTVRFLERANAHLATDGQILLLFSSLTNKNRVEEAIAQQLFVFKELERAHIFFEDLFVYLITKSALLKRIENAGVKQLSYLARGKRSWVFRGEYRSKECVVKVKRADSEANAPPKEGKVLKLVNKLGIGPQLFLAAKDFAVYQFIKGTYFEDALAKASKSEKKALFRKLFAQAFVLDQAGLAKEEMLRPLKNALVTPSGKLVLIDFERTHRVNKPHNVTQVCTFAVKQGIASMKAMQHTAKHYKTSPTKANFNALLKDMNL